MGLYAKNAKLYADEDMEFYIPMAYFEKNRYATNMGEYVETIGIIYTKTNNGNYQLFTVPATIKLYVYTIREDEIEINGSHMNVYVLEYVKDCHGTIHRAWDCHCIQIRKSYPWRKITVCNFIRRSDFYLVEESRDCRIYITNTIEDYGIDLG